MRILAYIFSGIILYVGLTLGIDVAELEKLFDQENYEQLKKALQSSTATSEDDPSILFFRGFLQENPEAAVGDYLRVADEFPNSKYADFSLFRLGQYYYFKANYVEARRFFSRLILNYRQSELRDDAQYLYCQCIMAAGKTDSAKLFLKAFVQNVERSPFVDAAILDLESLGGLPQQSLSQPALKKKSVVFAIQVASYINRSDAQDAIRKLSHVFPHVRVGERTLGNTLYYLVLIGKFESREKAAAYARLYIAPHLTEYKIVEQTP
ncbi:SPOR domain-containing protein [candidate division KSB1 bacterium]|nr:SPOR domain-containing protein [candidate division KSB1 bacterium]